VKDVLPGFLAEGEQIVWSGQPDPRRTGAAFLGHAVIGLACAGLPLLGAVRGDTPFVVAFPFAAFGTLFAARPVIMRHRAARTVLAVTTKRVVVLRQKVGGRHALRWVKFQDIAALETRRRLTTAETFHSPPRPGRERLRDRLLGEIDLNPLCRSRRSRDTWAFVGCPPLTRCHAGVAVGLSTAL
jgi:hypothetical protein